jgi:hypothetical protein
LHGEVNHDQAIEAIGIPEVDECSLDRRLMCTAEVENLPPAWQRLHEQATAPMYGDQRIPVVHSTLEPELVAPPNLGQERVPASGSFSQVLPIHLEAVFVWLTLEKEAVCESDEVLITEV